MAKSVTALKNTMRSETCRYCKGPDPKCGVCRGSGIVIASEWDRLKKSDQIELLEKENADLRRQLLQLEPPVI